MSSRRTAGQRRLPELLAKVAAGDTVIVSELSRLGRSLREVLGLIEELIHQKRCRLILVKQGLDLDPQNHRDMTHKILLTIFAMLAELERDFVSERTKEGLRARREQGIVLGKPTRVSCSRPCTTPTASASCTYTRWACRWPPSSTYT